MVISRAHSTAAARLFTVVAPAATAAEAVAAGFAGDGAKP
jgi:hypothetical protein